MKIASSSMFFDIIYCLGLISFLILFFFEIKIKFLTYFIVIFSITSLVIRLLNWQYLKKNGVIFFKSNQKQILIKIIIFCILINITPVYCIIQEPSLVVSHYVSMLTLFIATILAIAGVVLEKWMIK